MRPSGSTTSTLGDGLWRQWPSSIPTPAPSTAVQEGRRPLTQEARLLGKGLVFSPERANGGRLGPECLGAPHPSLVPRLGSVTRQPSVQGWGKRACN